DGVGGALVDELRRTLRELQSARAGADGLTVLVAAHGAEHDDHDRRDEERTAHRQPPPCLRGQTTPPGRPSASGPPLLRRAGWLRCSGRLRWPGRRRCGGRWCGCRVLLGGRVRRGRGV